MALKFGGAQSLLLWNTITTDEGCLPTDGPKLAVGHTQTLLFGPEEVGPF
jgi:hypothetical protein